ncbi:pentatricopeptide repeat-containing protein At3g47530-like [Chenopodium quinoa]|uniref:pentatricopeptide repeat-containing protein At3g47530-like n=1 Tax=Chenopodium quinoa TaxID=63459 RepID=UPI000B78C170|nr:pentatricopeptide repeat-containing protein At3g47530-like [Chenopodium quinoa]
MPTTPTSLLRRPSSATSIFFLRLFSSSSSSLSLLEEDDSATLSNFIPQKPRFQKHHQWRQTLESHLQRREHLFSLLQSCSTHTHFLQLHTQFVYTDLIQHPRLSLKFLARAVRICPQNVVYLFRIFNQIVMPTSLHYNTMIRAFSCSGIPSDGVKFYRMMKREGVESNHLTLSFCLDCCTENSALIEGMQIHKSVLVDGYERDCVLMTSLMELYSGCRRCDDACKVFDNMPHRDTVAYNALISCFVNNKRTRDALSVYKSMLTLERDCRPDEVTCLLLIQACGELGALDFGRCVVNYMEKHGYGTSMRLSNALIAMYSKCGCVDDAYRIFERMPTKNLVSWSSMISGFGINGYGKHAVELFWEMHRMGIAPDAKAITAVLYACSHRGLLDEGLLIFEKMTQEFGIHPNIHHYGCVVDILGRAGSLDQAYDLIISMKDKPDIKVWRTLLMACRMHKNFGLAERVIEHITELKAQEAGNYILLLNTYSSNGKWNKVRELRKFMEEQGILTTGSSTIEVKGMVHKFVVGNVSHPRKDEIYEMLNEILQQLKIAGYVPEASSELHDLDLIEKETAASSHSEKLAIAFGVLSTPPSTTIRVANSAQICDDCHNFAKVFSAVYNRKLIISDPNRIHHFREGKCSCDYCW